jgi:hypothetical protein
MSTKYTNDVVDLVQESVNSDSDVDEPLEDSIAESRGSIQLPDKREQDADDVEVDESLSLRSVSGLQDAKEGNPSRREVLIEVNGQNTESLVRTKGPSESSGKKDERKSLALTMNASTSRLPQLQSTIALAPKKLPAPSMTMLETRLPVDNVMQRIWLYETLVRFDVFQIPKTKVLQKLDRFDDWTEEQLFCILESVVCFMARIKTVHQASQKKPLQGLVKALKDAARDPRNIATWTAAQLFCEKQGVQIVDLEAVELKAEQEAKLTTLEPAENVSDTLLNRRATTSRRAANAAARARVQGLLAGDDEVSKDIVVPSRAMRAQSRILKRGMDVEQTAEERDHKAHRETSTVPLKRGRGRPRKVVVEVVDESCDNDLIEGADQPGHDDDEERISYGKKGRDTRWLVVNNEEGMSTAGNSSVNYSSELSEEEDGSSQSGTEDADVSASPSVLTLAANVSTEPTEKHEAVSRSQSSNAELNDIDQLPHFERRIALVSALVELALQTAEIGKEVEDGILEVKRYEKEGKLEEREMQIEHDVRREEVNAKRTDMYRIGKGEEWEREIAALIKEQAYARIDQRMHTHLLCDANKPRSGPLGRDTDGTEYWHLSEFNEARPLTVTGHWAWSLLVLKTEKGKQAFYGIETSSGVDELIAYVQDRCRVHEESERQSEGAKVAMLRQQIEAMVRQSVNGQDNSAESMDSVVLAIDAAKRARADESNALQVLQHHRKIELALLVGKLKTVKEYYIWHEAEQSD